MRGVDVHEFNPERTAATRYEATIARRAASGWGRLTSPLCWVPLAILLCFPAHSEAQQAKRPYRIGVINAAYAASHPTVEGLKAGLKELGFEDGRDVTFDIRFTEGKLDAMPIA